MSTTMLELKVSGPFACFTRPEAKVERMSYPVMTPSAARGILEAVFWKPEFSWQVREISVLNGIKWFSIKRNEINSRQRDRSDAYVADDPRERAQRHTLALRDVAYIIRADIELRPHASDHVAKYRDMFRRRVERGQCFQQPYFGCREFAATFSAPDGSERAIDLTMDLGPMLRDVEFQDAADGPISFMTHGPGGALLQRGHANPTFFQARLENGTMRVPQLRGGV